MILHRLATNTRSHPLSEVKRVLVWLVLRFVRTWEARMRIVLPFFPVLFLFSSLPFLFPLFSQQESGVGEKDAVKKSLLNNHTYLSFYLPYIHHTRQLIRRSLLKWRTSLVPSTVTTAVDYG